MRQKRHSFLLGTKFLRGGGKSKSMIKISNILMQYLKIQINAKFVK